MPAIGVPRALNLFIDFSETSKKLTNANPEAYTELLKSIPADWFNSLTNAIHLSKNLGRPQKDIYTLQRRLSGLSAITSSPNTDNQIQLLNQLVHDSGLDIYRDGLNLGLAHETRACVAIHMRDWNGFNTHAGICAEQYKVGQNSTLTAKFEKFLLEAASARFEFSGVFPNKIDFEDIETITVSAEIADLISIGTSQEERAQSVLQILVKRCNCMGGVLYTMRGKLPVRAARDRTDSLPDNLDKLVQNFLSSRLEWNNDETVSIASEKEASSDNIQWVDREGRAHCPLVLGYFGRDDYKISGVAVLLLNPNEPFNVSDRVILSIGKAL